MSDYSRFLSYIYLYENGLKTMNAGFVKVESRNGQCRVGLSLKNVYTGLERCQVYMFLRFGQDLRGIYIGDVQIKNHGGEWNFRTDTSNIAGSDYRLDQMSGMVIRGDGDKFYGTRWDHGDLDIRRFMTQWEEGQKTDPEPQPEPEPEGALQPEIEPEPESAEEAEEGTLTTMAEDERCRNLGKMMENCPGMYPFEDDSIEACVRLEPQDIGMMPIDCWAYGSNSFLLHGYYSYRHLILARVKPGKAAGRKYILGVPGTRHSRESFMANMFGFREFKPIREGQEGASDFGYWYTYLA